MPLPEIKKYKLLGKYPSHIPEADLLDYFVHTFEMTWTSPVYEKVDTSIKQYLHTLILSLSEKQNISKEQTWWALVLFVLKDFCMEDKFLYAVETINMLLNKISKLSSIELEEYCNEIDNAVSLELSSALVVRPLEVTNLNTDVTDIDIVLKKLLDNKAKLLDIFSKSLNKNDINTQHIDAYMFNDVKIRSKFFSFWETYLELFICHYLSMHEKFETSPQSENLNMHCKQILNNRFTFFKLSIKNKAKIAGLNEQITQILEQSI